jgi:Matrixin
MEERQRTRLVGLLIAFMVVAVGWNVIEKQRPAPAPAPPAPVVSEPPPPAVRPDRSAQVGTRTASTDSDAPGYLDLVARAEIRRRIRAAAPGTYLNEIVAESRDSMLHRWDERERRPVRVFLPPGRVANFQPSFLDAVRSAFQRWQETGVPVRFDLDADSADAEVRFAWRIQFEIDRTGETDLEWDHNGRLLSGLVTIATFDPNGQPLGADDVRVVALHEIGHLIGLDHSPDSTDVMFAKAKVRDLSARDVRTARLLYDLAPGSLR